MRGVFSIWRKAAGTATARPLPFVAVSLLLTGTTFLQWKMGIFDGVKGPEADRGLFLLFVFGKLVVILTWLLASLRLAADVSAPSLLSLTKKQALWIGALFLIMPGALIVRMLLGKILGTLLGPLDLDPRIVLLLSMATYLAIFFYVQMRLMPALIGVLIGDAQASLRWSWRAMKGRALPAILLVLGTMLPLFFIHFGNGALWLPESAPLRAAVLLFDGIVMAFLMLASSAAYVQIYTAAREKAEGDGPTQLLATG